MKKLFTLFLCGGTLLLHAQTTLYSEDFEGASSTFTLNTTDLSSTASGYNTWIINNTYAGGNFTDNVCGTGSIPIATTPSQPGAINNSPNSKYLHITNLDASSQGVANANFAASDGGLFCHDDEYNFAKMTSDISTLGQTGVTFSCYWLCAGSNATYGELYYSTDGGGSWNLKQGNMQAQSSWIQLSVTDANFDNKATLRFGFRFVNTFSFSASDPPVCVDEIKITVPAAAGITTGTLTPAGPYCAGATLTVPYTISGTFTAGNVFTAQLSDGTGSFAAPTTIGSVASTSAGSINCTIPAGTPTGIGYMVRVTSSNPVATGTSSAAFTINALPAPVASNTGPYCAGNTILLNSTAVGMDYDWTGPNSYVANNTQNPSILNSTLAMTGTYTVTVTTSAGCSATTTTAVSVVDCSGIGEEEMASISVYPNPTSDMFTLCIHETLVNEASVRIINMVGEVVSILTPNQSKTYISTKALGLKSGIYLVSVDYTHQSKVLRLIVQ